MGCFRTQDEIRDWLIITDESKIDIMNDCQKRRKSYEESFTFSSENRTDYKIKVGRERMVVVETSDEEVLLAAISSYKKLSTKDAMDWNLLEEEDLKHL